MSSIYATNLRVEYKRSPLGLDDLIPRFSWEVMGCRRNCFQRAYQILVASSPEFLAKDCGDLWDSGRVTSDETFHIEYAGKPLVSRMTCWWKVRLWDAEDVVSDYSEPAFWTMGLLRDEDWQAEWIGFDEPAPSHELIPEVMHLDGVSWISNVMKPQPTTQGAVLVFRRTFRISKPVRRVRFVAASGGQYAVFLDGERVGGSDGRFWAWIRPQQFDLTSKLFVGGHTLAVENQFLHAPAPGLIGKLVVEYTDGSTEEVRTDERWKVAEAPSGDWWAPGYDDNAWGDAKVVCEAGGAPWGRIAPTPIEIPACPYLRRKFAVDNPITRATLYVTALGLYEILINGERVGDLRFVPGWTDYKQRVLYQTYDVTAMVREGENAIAAVLGHGWYSGYLGFDIMTRGHYGKNPRLLAQLEIETADGTVCIVSSDASWKGSYGGIIGSDIYMGEIHDARREPADWVSATFKDDDWRPVTVGGPNSIKLEAHPGSPVRITMEMSPKSLHKSPTGSWIFDMGQNMVGVVRVRITGAPGSRHVFRFGEMLNTDGSLYIENLRNARATDEYIKGTDEPEVWQPRFTFHGFRYVEWIGPETEPPLDSLTGLVMHSDAEVTGSFECSNPTINRLQQNILWGQRGNYFETPTDCPQRDERLGWMGDAQVFAPTGCFNMDAAPFFTKWMRDVVEAQSPEGAFADVAPRYVHTSENVPGWADAGVIVPWTVYEAYGDKRILARTYEAMCRYVDNLEKHNPDYLWLNKRGNDYGDWLSIQADTPKEVVATAFFARSADLVSRVAGLLDKPEDAKRYRGIFEKVKDAFVRAYVQADGTIHGDTQTCYILALRFGLLEGELRHAAESHLIDRIKERDWHLSTGFLGCAYALPTLTEIGRSDVAYRLLENTDFPSWGYPIQHGATTMWERWDGWTHHKGFQDPGMNSFNHYAFGAVGEWMYRTMAGLCPAAPGYRQVKIAPQVGGHFTFVRAEYHSICGHILSEWRMENGLLRLRVRIPANTKAIVRVPSKAPDRVREITCGSDARVAPTQCESDAAIFEIGSGEYLFESEWK